MNAADFGQLIKDHPEILNDSKKFVAFLRDVFPTEKGNVNQMLIAYNAGVVSMLRKSNLDSLLTTRIMSLLMDDYGIAEERAKWAAELWINAYAFSMGRMIQPEPQRMAATQSQTSVRPAVSTPVQRTSPGGSGCDKKPIADFFTKIVGVTHNNTDANTENRQAIIQDLKSRGQLEPGQALMLELDTENRWSKNAVKVIAPDGRQLGYLSQTVADKNAPQMRDGYEYQAFVSAVTGGENGFVYGVNIRIVVYEPAILAQPSLTGSSQGASELKLNTGPIFLTLCESNPQYFQMDITEFGGRITKYIGPQTEEIVIPSTINGIQIVEIGNKAFSKYPGLTSLTIPDSITIIGNSAFKGCDNLVIYTLPGSYAEKYARAKQIPYQIVGSKQETTSPAFLKPVPIQKPVATATSDVTKIALIQELITILSTLKQTSTAFNQRYFEIEKLSSNCCIKKYIGPNNGEIVIPAKIFGNLVTKIGYSAFDGCGNLTGISIPNCVTTIGHRAFSDCAGLTSIVIPDGVTTIGNEAFNGCTGLKNIIIPNSVKHIGFWAFKGCTNLSNVIICSRTTVIGDWAFSGCPLLVIHAPAYSVAERYAKQQNIQFKPPISSQLVQTV